jgi:hypothetical protein
MSVTRLCPWNMKFPPRKRPTSNLTHHHIKNVHDRPSQTEKEKTCSLLLLTKKGQHNTTHNKTAKMTRRHGKEAVKPQSGDKVTPVYIRSKDHSWQPVLQIKVHDCGKKATICKPIFKDEQSMLHCNKNRDKQKYARDNEVVDLVDYPNHVLPMQNVDSDGNLDDYKDMVELPFMHEVRMLKERSFFQKIVPRDKKLTQTRLLSPPHFKKNYHQIRRPFCTISKSVTWPKSHTRARVTLSLP